MYIRQERESIDGAASKWSDAHESMYGPFIDTEEDSASRRYP